MLVLRARFVISGVTPDHIPALPLQWKAEKPAHIFKTSGHFISNSVNSRPSFKKKKKKRGLSFYHYFYLVYLLVEGLSFWLLILQK